MQPRIARSLVALAVLSAAAAAHGHAAPGARAFAEPGSAEHRARALIAAASRDAAAPILHQVFALGELDASAALDARADALETILGAVRSAERMRSAAVAPLTDAQQRLVLDSPFRRVASPHVPGRSVQLGDRLELRPAVLAMARRVDTGAMARAAVLLVAAVEHAAPALGLIPQDKLAPATCPGISGDVIIESEDCSIVVAGIGANTYTGAADPTVLIDLGGNDIYRGDSAFAEQGVEVLIDLDGNDTYTRSASFTDPGDDVAIGAQGGGVLGVGVLADLGGNDSYTLAMDATAPQPGPVARSVGPTGQGTGIIGAGVLLDARGSDSYAITATSSGGPATLFGQGAALGAAALVDLGTENDIYSLSPSSTLHHTAADANQSLYQIGLVAGAGQGAGLLGVGAAVDSAGDDIYEVVARGAGADISAHGAGVGGVGVLVDAAGNDAMRARALGDVRLVTETTRTDVCWEAFVSVASAGALAIGQGGAALGAGILVDGGGNDERLLEALDRTEASATVTSALDCTNLGNSAEAISEAAQGRATGQAAAHATAVGVLVDLGGSDDNSIIGTSEAVASVTISSPGPDTAITTTSALDGLVQGQSYNSFGAALLVDVLGNDTYTSRASTITTETETIDGVPTAISSLVPGDERIHGYSEGDVIAWFVDLDGDETYSSFAGATAAADNTCWNNNPSSSEGRGRDLSLAVPTGCP